MAERKKKATQATLNPVDLATVEDSQRPDSKKLEHPNNAEREGPIRTPTNIGGAKADLNPEDASTAT